MDIVSHSLIGIALVTPVAGNSVNLAAVIAASALPDVMQIPLYFFIGHKNKRRLFIPAHKDWEGFRHRHPFWFAFWELPSSLLFWGFVVMPLLWFFKLPMILGLVYLAHLILDIFTHKGVWAVKLFYPFNFSISGFTNAWSWPAKYWVMSWVFLGWAVFYLRFVFLQ